ncbi:MAG: hypothetical protein JWO22_1262 [Frankiales bacterium]|nr:hypothetical protein [Frankiales bacterium]
MNRFVLLAAAVVVAAFAVGTALGLAFGATGGTAGSSASAAATGSPTAAAISLPPLYTGCRPQQVPVGTGVTCGTSLAGVEQVLVVQWPDAATMQADFARTQGGKPDGKCSTYDGRDPSGVRSTWGNGKPLACYVNTNGAAVVLWEDPAKRLELLAVRGDGDTVKAFAWWTQAIKTPL